MEMAACVNCGKNIYRGGIFNNKREHLWVHESGRRKCDVIVPLAEPHPDSIRLAGAEAEQLGYTEQTGEQPPDRR